LLAVRTKKTLAKAMKQNRQVPQWIRFRTGNTVRPPAAPPPLPAPAQPSKQAERLSTRLDRKLTPAPDAVCFQIRYNNKRRHWRRTKLGL